MEKWDELRTAYWVARLGTLSAAASQLGMHRATVARHVDLLEEALGAKLFQRHGRGYEPTEAGEDLLRVGRGASEQFREFAGRTRGRSNRVSGELIVTTLELLGPVVMPALASFRRRHPDCLLRVEASGRLFKLEYGEAHVAVRMGTRPEHPDNIVHPLLQLRSALYAHRSYIDEHGLPAGPDSYARYGFVMDGTREQPGVLTRWLVELAPDAPTVFHSANLHMRTQAIEMGLGIGFMPARIAATNSDLVQVHPPLENWEIPVWLVTHVDLNRTPKVQAVLAELRKLADTG